MNEEHTADKTSYRYLLFDFIDSLRAGAVISVDFPGECCGDILKDRELLDQIAYAVEKHLRQ